MTNTIVSVLQADPISLHIVRFLLKNKRAMDSAKGIAAWWVGCDELAVQTALDRLTACTVLEAHTFKSCTLYGLTANEETRGWLEAWFNDNQKGNTSRASLKHLAVKPNPGSLTVLQTVEQAKA